MRDVLRGASILRWWAHGGRLKGHNLPRASAPEENTHDAVGAAEIRISIVALHGGDGR
jgi:hypothetical protein